MNATARVLIMAGGTGGHVFPALAIAEALRADGVAIDWLGTRQGIEARLVPAAGIPLHAISVAGLRGKGWGALLKAPWQLGRALWESLALLRRLRPDCVLGMGGFAAGPGGLAAWLLRCPLVIHEQNAVAGTTNRLLARLACRVLAAFPSALAGAELVGNPVRESIAALPQPAGRQLGEHRPRRLLVLGGSLGANRLNTLLPEAVAATGLPIAVWHQSGARDADAVQAAYVAAGITARVDAFIDDMAAAYGWADLAVCRAGALTVAELAAAGLGALLVPYPYAIDDHQTRNAEWLCTAGAAELMPQARLDRQMLAERLQQLLGDPQALRVMAEQARRLARPDAAHRAAAVCREVMHG